MLAEMLMRSLHLIALLVLITAVLIHNIGFSRQLNREDIINLRRVDRAIHGGMALILLAGLALWLWVGKPAAFYNGNGLFHIKLLLFVIFVLLAGNNTLFLRRHRQLDAAHTVTFSSARRVGLRLEMALLLIIPVLAYLMARGVGY